MPAIDFPLCSPRAQAASTQARRERMTMPTATTETRSLGVFTLPGTPYSVQMARFYVRAALGYHDLGDYVENIELVTSELVTNAIAHASAHAINLELIRLEGPRAVEVIVTDSSPRPPVRLDPTDDAQHGRGLHIVEALSTRWGWIPRGSGKAVFAIFTREG
jgi:anti-sigma regulatory factor (Ser/Thr protein kinase)